MLRNEERNKFEKTIKIFEKLDKNFYVNRNEKRHKKNVFFLCLLPGHSPGKKKQSRAEEFIKF